MILPPQLLAKKSSASQPKAKTRPMLPDQSAAEEFPLPAKNDARQANLAHLKAVDSAMTRSNGHGLAAFLPNRLVGALPHGARRYFVEQPCKLTADGVRQRAPWCKQICICIYVSINIDIYIYIAKSIHTSIHVLHVQVSLLECPACAFVCIYVRDMNVCACSIRTCTIPLICPPQCCSCRPACRRLTSQKPTRCRW